MKTPMPLSVGDYMGATIGLTRSQHGAYLLSMMQYWDKGEALTAGELREACGTDIDRVSRFFVMEGGRWHHKRIDAELAAAAESFLKRRNKAMKMVAARRALGQIPNRTVDGVEADK